MLPSCRIVDAQSNADNLVLETFLSVYDMSGPAQILGSRRRQRWPRAVAALVAEKGGRASAGALADSSALPMSMAKITMRSSGEVQPPEAVLGAGIDLTKQGIQNRLRMDRV